MHWRIYSERKWLQIISKGWFTLLQNTHIIWVQQDAKRKRRAAGIEMKSPECARNAAHEDLQCIARNAAQLTRIRMQRIVGIRVRDYPRFGVRNS
jgi:hypothetical protein